MYSKKFPFPVMWYWFLGNTLSDPIQQFEGDTKFMYINDEYVETGTPFTFKFGVNKLNFIEGTEFTEIGVNGGVWIRPVDKNGNDIPNSPLPRLTYFTKLKKLYFKHAGFSSGLANISMCTTLEHLTLSDLNDSFTDSFDNLKNLVNLKTLSLYDTPITGPVTCLQNMHKLEYLNVEGTHIRTKLDYYFNNMPNLRYIQSRGAWYGGGFNGGTLYGKFIDCPNLEVLKLPFTFLDGRIADLHNCKKLKYIDLAHNDGLIGDLDNLSSLTELEYVDVSRIWGPGHYEGGLSNVNGLKDLPKLTHIDICGQHYVDHQLDFGDTMVNLEYLDCLRCSCYEEPLGLDKIEKLTYINFNENNLDQEALDNILQALVDSGIEDGSVYLEDNKEEPSDDGKDNADTLEDRGWDVRY